MAYNSLSTSTLPDPGVDPNAAQEPRDYFETFLYTGNGTGLQVGDVIKKPADTTTISNSLLFNDNDDAYLTWTPSVDGTSSSKFTMSMWFKKTVSINPSGAYQVLFSFGADTNNNVLCYFSTSSNTLDFWVKSGGSYICRRITDAAYADVSSWYHLVVAYDNDNAGTNDLVKIYINGVQVTGFASITNTGGSTVSGTQVRHDIGAWWSTQTTNTFDGYMAEVHFVDGTALTSSSFGNFDANGIWIPKAVTGITYGTNGFYLDFSDNTSTTTLGADQTANGNDWTLNNFATTDQVTDSPTNNFETLQSSNAVDLLGAATISEGNLRATSGGSNSRAAIGQTFVTSGKWYAEVTITTSFADYVGIGSRDNANSTYSQADKTGAYSYLSNGNKDSGLAAATSYGATYTSGDVIGIAYNADDGELTFYKNGTSQGVAFTGIDTTIPRAFAGFNGGTGNYVHDWNFGQKGFTYTPPTGFVALSENNITVDDQNLESPDFVWIKNRDQADQHHLYDSVRGIQKALYSSATTAETAEPNGLVDFNKNGFTIGSEVEVNTANEDYVAWCWKANGATGVSNTNGSITSTVSANTTSGFSIVKYTGTGANATVGHGLSSTPEMVIIKGLDTAYDWVVWVDGFSTTQRLLLNTTGATSAGNWNTLPTSSVFGLGTHLNINNNGSNHIAYCFHSVDGFSKFGSYTGNGSTNGPFVYTGFRPAFVMIKRSSGIGWWTMFDTAREPYNDGSAGVLAAQSSGAESTQLSSSNFDILSNGFKIGSDTNSADVNASGNTYIYMAFAETPFKYATAR